MVNFHQATLFIRAGGDPWKSLQEMTGKSLFPAYTSDADEDSMPREYGVDATNPPTINSVGDDLQSVDSNMEADVRRRNKFRMNHFMQQRYGR